MIRSSKKPLFLLWALALVLVLGPPAFAQQSEEQKIQAAVAAAEKFARLVDAGKYEKSWEQASDLFKSQVARETWVLEISRLRPLFGPVVSRTVKNTKYMTSAPGAPDGEYVLILFQSTFKHKQHAVETITPILDSDGQWRVSGYFIR